MFISLDGNFAMSQLRVFLAGEEHECLAAALHGLSTKA